MKIKGAIFDLDGTLIDSMPLWENLGIDFLKSIGISPSTQLKETLKTMSLAEAAQYFQKQFNVNISDGDIINRLGKMIERQYRESIAIKKSAKSFIQRLHDKNIKMCIATANVHTLTQAALKRLDVYHYFEGIITFNEAEVGKDDPQFFLKALELITTPVEETVVFEDSLHAAKSAKKAGFKVAVVYDESSKDDMLELKKIADWYIYSYDELELDY